MTADANAVFPADGAANVYTTVFGSGCPAGGPRSEEIQDAKTLTRFPPRLWPVSIRVASAGTSCVRNEASVCPAQDALVRLLA